MRSEGPDSSNIIIIVGIILFMVGQSCLGVSTPYIILTGVGFVVLSLVYLALPDELTLRLLGAGDGARRLTAPTRDEVSIGQLLKRGWRFEEGSPPHERWTYFHDNLELQGHTEDQRLLVYHVIYTLAQPLPETLWAPAEGEVARELRDASGAYTLRLEVPAFWTMLTFSPLVGLSSKVDRLTLKSFEIEATAIKLTFHQQGKQLHGNALLQMERAAIKLSDELDRLRPMSTEQLLARYLTRQRFLEDEHELLHKALEVALKMEPTSAPHKEARQLLSADDVKVNITKLHPSHPQLIESYCTLRSLALTGLPVPLEKAPELRKQPSLMGDIVRGGATMERAAALALRAALGALPAQATEIARSFFEGQSFQTMPDAILEADRQSPGILRDPAWIPALAMALARFERAPAGQIFAALEAQQRAALLLDAYLSLLSITPTHEAVPAAAFALLLELPDSALSEETLMYMVRRCADENSIEKLERYWALWFDTAREDPRRMQLLWLSLSAYQPPARKLETLLPYASTLTQLSNEDLLQPGVLALLSALLFLPQAQPHHIDQLLTRVYALPPSPALLQWSARYIEQATPQLKPRLEHLHAHILEMSTRMAGALSTASLDSQDQQGRLSLAAEAGTLTVHDDAS